MVTEQEIRDAGRALNAGGLVAFPTETVYGLGANALNPQAVAGIFELKGRPKFDPLIVHIANPMQLSDLVRSVPQRAQQLIRAFWPGPLSIVLERKTCIPDIVSAGLPTVAVRCPAHATAKALIEAAGVPLSAPSANRFGMVSPTTAQHVRDQFDETQLTILDDGPCRVGVESTVVSFATDSECTPVLLRHGGITLEQLEDVIGTVSSSINEESQPQSPGQLSRHYSPSTPLSILPSPGASDVVSDRKRFGLLSFTQVNTWNEYGAVEVLSADGCLTEAAVNLFAALRRLDAMQFDGIIATPVPEVGLGRAIMDRLRRAATR